jgi:hypothetical protein
MSGVRIDGVWRQPAITSVKVGGTWRTVSTISAKIDGVWRTTTFAGPPPPPTLSYTAQNQFTITNYNAALVYAVSGATRAGSLLTSVSNGATIATSYAVGATISNVSTMNVLAHGRVLTTSFGVTDTGCGPRGNICCPGGTIQDTSGNVCGGAPGSYIADPAQAAAFCGGACDYNCYQLTVTCYNWYFTDYTGSGYTLMGNVWGKATNG